MSSQLGSSKNQACVSDLLLLYAPVATVTLAGGVFLAYLVSSCTAEEYQFRFGTGSLQRTEGCLWSQGNLGVCHSIWSYLSVN